jgi:hypothetical protein
MLNTSANAVTERAVPSLMVIKTASQHGVKTLGTCDSVTRSDRHADQQATRHPTADPHVNRVYGKSLHLPYLYRP